MLFIWKNASVPQQINLARSPAGKTSKKLPLYFFPESLDFRRKNVGTFLTGHFLPF